MEYEIDCDIIGEIMIPLENNTDQDQTLESVLERNFKDFRSILFQGELVRLFVVVKIDRTKDIEEFMNNIYIKFEFDSSCDENELEFKKANEIQNSSNTGNISNINNPPNITSMNFNIENNPYSKSALAFDETDSSQLMTDVNFSDMFSLLRSSLFNKFSEGKKTIYNYKNKNYDFISRKIIIKEKNIMIFEVLKHIIVPNKFLNKNLIMKLNIMKKNDLEFIKKYSMSEIFSSGVYDEVKEFTIVKTLFKEVKIIRPLYISKTRQIDILPDTSLLQIKIENITSSINFIDKNLKVSKFLGAESGSDQDVLNYGMSLVIKEMQALKEETVVDKKMTINVKSLEQYIKNDSIPLDNVHFSLMNNDFPIEIKPGEEVVLMMKIFKSAFIYENSKQDSKDIGMSNTLSLSNVNQNYCSNSNLLRRSSSNLNSINNNPILNTTNPLMTQSSPIIHNYNYNNFSNQIQPNKSNVTINTPLVNPDILPIDNDEIIKVVLSTPLILNISSFKFYDSLFMSIPIKWHKEITRFLKVEIDIQDNIALHEYFYVNLRAKNISNLPMDLILEISDSASDFISNSCIPNFDTEIFDYKGKKIDQIPSILSETKLKNIGNINPNEEKLIDLRFLPLKNGFNSLSSFNIVDKNSQKSFFVVHTNKIYVREK